MFLHFHAHLYFKAETLSFAQELAKKAGSELPVEVGRVWEKPVGPHPVWSCQLKFSGNDFSQVVVWLMKNRGPLDVFVHGLSEDDFKDHTDSVMWLGKSYELKLEGFKK